MTQLNRHRSLIARCRKLLDANSIPVHGPDRYSDEEQVELYFREAITPSRMRIRAMEMACYLSIYYATSKPDESLIAEAGRFVDSASQDQRQKYAKDKEQALIWLEQSLEKS